MSTSSQPGNNMPLIAHLTELRTRLLRCVMTVLLVFAALFYFAQDIYALDRKSVV